MPAWVEFIQNIEPIKAIYGNHLPSGNGLRLQELILSQDGPAVTFHLDFPEYPVEPPRKWVAAKANTVYAEIQASEVYHFTMTGLARNMIVDMVVLPEGANLAINLSGSGVQIEVLTDFLYVQKIGAYWNTTRPLPE